MRYAVVCIMYINIKFHYTLLILYCTLLHYFNKFSRRGEKYIIPLFADSFFTFYFCGVQSCCARGVRCGGGAQWLSTLCGQLLC